MLQKMSFSSNDLTFPFQICAWNFNEGGPGLPKRIGAREKEATLLSEANISSTCVWSPILDILVKISPNSKLSGKGSSKSNSRRYFSNTGLLVNICPILKFLAMFFFPILDKDFSNTDSSVNICQILAFLAKSNIYII